MKPPSQDSSAPTATRSGRKPVRPATDEHYRRWILDADNKSVARNTRFRVKLLAAAKKNRAIQLHVKKMCSEDILYFINFACSIYEPRTMKVLPWITYDFQDRLFDDLLNSIGVQDRVLLKSRDMGASWCTLAAFLWLWQFGTPRQRSAFLVLSRVEPLVDSRGNPDSLFWKLKFLLDSQPKWLVPRHEKIHMHLGNLENGSTIDGQATTAFAGVAGRRTAILLDEFSLMEGQQMILAGTRDVTYSRIFSFTPKGASNTAYQIAEGPDSRFFAKTRMHWSEHPLKKPGLYRSLPDGTIERLDPAYEYPIDYQFVADGKLRSPWYDLEDAREPNKRLLAQELDIDFFASDFSYFDPKMLEIHAVKHARDPVVEGDIDYDITTCEPHGTIARKNGPLWSWLKLTGAGLPPGDRDYIVGVDVAAGTGSSNSTICVLDRKSNEQVAEWADSNTPPHTLAKVAVAICKWFAGSHGGAFLIWEANGAGRTFETSVLNLKYKRLFYRRNENSISRAVQDKLGWWASPETQAEGYGEYRRAIYGDELIVRSKAQLEECRQYVHHADGAPWHSAALRTDDPTGAKANHGDRPTAMMLCWYAARRMGRGMIQRESHAPKILPGSLAWRHRMSEEEEHERRKPAWPVVAR